MGGGKERKMNGGLATADHVKDRRKGLKQKLSKTESAIKNILLKKLSAQEDFRVLSKHTSYVERCDNDVNKIVTLNTLHMFCSLTFPLHKVTTFLSIDLFSVVYSMLLSLQYVIGNSTPMLAR
jgi:hypothetical protein